MGPRGNESTVHAGVAPGVTLERGRRRGGEERGAPVAIVVPKAKPFGLHNVYIKRDGERPQKSKGHSTWCSSFRTSEFF